MSEFLASQHSQHIEVQARVAPLRLNGVPNNSRSNKSPDAKP